MSEGARNMGDELAVVGEPASHPHHAAVVGEPPEDMIPVLGEPVPLANGLQNDQLSVSPPSPDESAVNGIHEETSPAAEPPSQSSDAPSSTASTVESSNPAMADDHIASEEVSAEESSHRSAIESPIPSDCNTETSEVHAHAQDGPDGLASTHEPNSDAAVSADVEVTHITDVPSEPPLPETREISIENPFAVLDEGSPETDLKVSTADKGPTATDVPLEVDEKAATAVEKEAHENKTNVESETPPLSKEEPTTEPTEREEKNVDDDVSEESKVSKPTKAEEVSPAEPKQVDTASKESDVNESSLEKTEEGVLDSSKDLVSTENEKVQEVQKMEESSTNSGTTVSEVEHVESREVSVPEENYKEEVATKDGEGVNSSIETSPNEADQVMNREPVLHEVFSSKKASDDQADTDSSLVHDDKDVSAKDLPMESSDLRAVANEASTREQPPSDETSLYENGFQHRQDGVPLESEQGLTRDDMPSSFFKRPLVITSVALGVMGVAFAALSRSRQQ